MRKFFTVPVVVALAASAVGFGLGQWAIGVVGLFLSLAFAASIVMRETRARYESAPDAGLSLDAQTRMRPLLKAHRDIESFVAEHREDPVLKVIGEEGLGESRQILETAARLLKDRTEYLRTGFQDEQVRLIDGQLGEARSALEELYRRLAMAGTAARSELGQETELRDAIGRLQSLNVSLDEAEQLLKETGR